MTVEAFLCYHCQTDSTNKMITIAKYLHTNNTQSNFTFKVDFIT